MVEQKSDGAESTSDADIVALKPGTRIGRHEVLAVLGQGGFGITYRAIDGQLHRDVAIKEYLPTLLAYRAGGTTVMPRSTKVAEDFAWGRDRFVAEGRTLASLHHAPGIVRVFDFLETNGTAYIVMEMLRGDTLEARIKAGPPLDGAEVERILRTLLDGLEQVHDAGFLHRDIKPANILLDHRGNPTLIDFGASRAAMTGRTVAMTAIFTPGYAATEQMTSAKQGPWTDIYGLSATLYHAIAGEPPPNAFDRLLDDEYKPLSRLAPPGFSPGLIAGIDAGLAVRASDRPQSIAGWRALLSMSAAGAADATQISSSRSIEGRSLDTDATMLARPPIASSSSSSSPSPSLSSTMQPAPPASPSSSPPRKSRAPLYAGVAAAVLLLAGGGGYLALSSSKPELPAPPQAVVLQDLKVEDLERALAERRAADAAAAEKRRLEEEAQRKAEADTAAKQAADAELVKAEAARKAAEEELARLKTEIEARRQEAQNEARRAEAEAAQRKAEAEMAALRQAEEEARRKAAAEAESKRLADEALAKAQAERQRTEEEAQRKAAAEKKEKADATAKQIAEAEAQEKAKAQAAAEAKEKADAEAAAKKTAEAAEAGLRLGLPERQRVQVALSSLGFDTRGSDGALGPRSREMIAAWQKARNRPATGFLDGAQHEALTREAAPALQKYDADQQKKEAEQKKKAEDEKKAAEEAAKAKAAAPAPATPAPATPAPTTPAPAVPVPAVPAPSPPAMAAAAPAGEARWSGRFKCDLWPGPGVPIVLAPVNGQVSQSFSGRGGTVVTISISGNRVSGNVTWRPRIGEKTLSGSFSATIQGNSITATTTSRSDFKGGPGPDESRCDLALSKTGG